MQYFVNGQVSRDMEWTNLNLQDILPTWQWWITSTDDNRLELDWDYGSKFYRYDSNGETFGYAGVTPIPTGSAVAKLVFTPKASGTTDVTITTTQINDTKVEITETVPVPATDRVFLPACNSSPGNSQVPALTDF